MTKYQCASLYDPRIPLLWKLKLLMQKYPNFSVKEWLYALPTMFPALFREPKKHGNYRMVLNLKRVSGFLKFKHCKRVSRRCTRPYHWGLLFWVRRIERCILYHLYSWKLPKISWSILERRILSTYCPYQWIFTSSKSLYKYFDPPFKYLGSKGHLFVKYIRNSLSYSWERLLRFISRLLELQFQSYGNKDSQFTQKSQSWFLLNRQCF